MKKGGCSMSKLDIMGNASFEKRQQNIMKLRVSCKKGQVATVKSAQQKFGVTEKTIISWAKEGEIPLLHQGMPIVPITPENRPSWW